MSYYYESKADRRNYHYVSHKEGPHAALHFHSAVEFLIVVRGRMLATVNGEEYVIKAGEGCFVDKFCTHAYSELENDTDVYSFVGNHALFESIFSDIGGTPPVKFKFSDLYLLDSLTKYYETAESDALRRSFFKGTITIILTRIAEENPLVSLGDRRSAEDICAILRYIGEHFTEDISLVSLSAEFGYSPQYFSRIFHKYMKINLTEYINIARVNYAKKQLDSGKSVAEIAFESGFGSMPSFYRAYKKVFGDLPRG